MKHTLNTAKKAAELANLNLSLIRKTRESLDKVALMLGEIIGLSEGERGESVLYTNIFHVAPKWTRQCNLYEKGKVNLETIGKVLGIEGSLLDVRNRLGLFKLFNGQYKLHRRLYVASNHLRALT